MVRVQKVLSLAVGMDATEFDRAMRKMYSELSKSRTATRPLSDSLLILKEALTKVTVTSEQQEIVQNRLIIQSAKRAEQIRKEAAAVRDLNSAWAAGVANTVAANKPFAKGLQGLKDNANRTTKPVNAAWSAGLANIAGSNDPFGKGLRGLTDNANRDSRAARQAADDAQFAADEARLGAQADQSAAARRRRKIERARRQAADDAQFAADEARILDQNAESDAARTAARRRRRIELAQQGADQTDDARARRTGLADQGRSYMSQFNDTRQNVRGQYREAIEQRRAGAISPEQYQRAVAGIRSQNSALNQSFASLKSTVGALVGPLVLAYSAYRGFIGSIKLSAELDEAKAKFRVFTGSLSEATRILTDVRKLSSESPVSFQGGQRALTTMLQYGVEAKNITGTLRTLATITGGNTERMESLSLAYAQANAAGRLMGQELLQMVNAGFNPLKVISEQTGKSMADLKAEMQDGQISFAMVEDAFKSATRDGGKFNGLLEEIAQTTAGKLNRAQSSLEQFGIAFGDMLKPATDGTLDMFIEDLGRIARSMQMIAGIKMETGSLMSLLLTASPLGAAKETLKLPSYIEDIAAAKAKVDPGTNKFSSVIQGKAEAIKRLKGSFFVSDTEVQAAEEYLKKIEKIKAAMEDGKTGTLSADEQAGAKYLKDQQDKATRSAKNTNDKTAAELAAKYDDESTKRQKAGAKQAELDKLFTDNIEKQGQGRFSDGAINNYNKIKARQEKAAADSKEQERVQAAFKDLQDSAAKDLVKSRYGDKAGNVGMLQEQATGDERKRLNAMIAAGAAYDDIVLAANEEAQAQADALDAVQEKTKAIEEAAAAQKKAADDTAKFDKAESDRFKARRVKYLSDLAGLEEDAKRMRAESNPNAALIEGLAQAGLLKDRGIITDKEFGTEQSRLLNDSVKNVSASAAPVVGRGTQEAYQFITGQTIDKITAQLQETEKIVLLQTTAVEVAKKTNEKLDELIAGIPEVVGP